MANQWNLEGSKSQEIEKVYLPELVDGEPKAYGGTIKEISEIYKQPKYNAEGEDEKITIGVEMEDGKKIPLFLNFKVMKGSGSYSNSKLYDVIETANGLTLAKNVENSMYPEKLNFLNTLLVGKKCKFLVKTVKKDQPDKYSVVDRMTKIWDITEGEKVEG